VIARSGSEHWIEEYTDWSSGVDHFSSANGLSSNTVSSFYQDHEGSVWVATSEGIDCFRDIPVVTFSADEGLKTDDVVSVLSAHDGTIWVGMTIRSMRFVMERCLQSGLAKACQVIKSHLCSKISLDGYGWA